MGILWAETADQYALWDALLMAHGAGNGYLLSWYLAHQQYPRVDVDVAVAEHQGRAAAGAVLYTFRLPCGTSVCLVPSSPICQRGQEKSVFQLVKALAERASRKGAMLIQFEAFEPRMRDVIRDGDTLSLAYVSWAHVVAVRVELDGEEYAGAKFDVVEFTVRVHIGDIQP